MVTAGTQFEIVFVSADRSDEAFEEYFKTMPWLALPFEDPRIEYLNSLFEVDGIPSLVLVDPTGKVLRTDLVDAITGDKLGINFPWPRKSIGTLGANMSQINEIPSLVIFSDGSVEQQVAAVELFQLAGVAEDAWAEVSGKPHRIFFSYISEDDADHSKGILGFLNLGDKATPHLVIIDMENRKKHVAASLPATSADLQALVAQFHEGALALVGVRD